ncbi:MAG TPA: AAA family ATPase [Candidatus Avidesulfovibrio excrementigallinarum]|nr:AAA family ATPase [Candidatus Avidesulfovibrio excrementigallinarum]
MPKHISVRVPWHDNGWNGQVCQRPAANTACTVLKNIAIKRHDPTFPRCEEAAKTSAPDGQPAAFTPPCLRESGFFLSPEAHTITVQHPYVFDRHYSHMLETTVDIPPHAFIGIPYGWLLRPDPNNTALSKHDIFFTQYKPDIEIPVASGTFISNGVNQKPIFEYFWRDVVPGQSMVTAYAKAIPLTDNPARVVVAIGRITGLGAMREYAYAEPPDYENRLSAWTWERPVTHSLTGAAAEGVLIPFAQIEAYLREHPEQKADDLLLFAPEAYRAEFSYGCEHVSPDAMILLLNRAITLLTTYQRLGFCAPDGLPWERQARWCRDRLEEVWRERGPYPGLGSVLTALGLRYAYDIADALRKRHPGPELWEHLAEHLESRHNLTALLPEEQQSIAKQTTGVTLKTLVADLKKMGDLLRLLARMELSVPQALLLLGRQQLPGWLIGYFNRLCELCSLSSEELTEQVCANPYTLYEQTRLLPPEYAIDINAIDLALFPPAPFRNEWFDDKGGTQIEDPDDERRLRALVTSILEAAADRGHTLCPQDEVLTACHQFRTDLPGVTVDIAVRERTLELFTRFFAPLFVRKNMIRLSDNGEQQATAWQLTRLADLDDEIRQAVENRLTNPPPAIQEDWNNALASTFGPLQAGDTREQASRAEKRQAIEKLADSGLGVLTGGAGTGKTSALVALCRSRQIQQGGILVLAPTGKARVVLSSALQQADIPHEAKTVFQFLLAEKRCDPITYRYYLSQRAPRHDIPQTVIVDECSMLTEEMLGTLFQCLQHAPRLILVGDPNQLPPIGTGKPFFELCVRLSQEEGQPHYARLQLNNRQGGLERTDVQLAALFSMEGQRCDRSLLAAAFERNDGTVTFVPCTQLEEVDKTVRATLNKIFDQLHLEGTENVRFDYSLGGQLAEHGQKYMNFDDAAGVENWQILTPWRNRAYCGSTALNSLLHEQFGQWTKRAEGIYKKRTDNLLGNDGICFGEKVINLENKNWGKDGVSPLRQDANPNQGPYATANGEIGIVSDLQRNWDAHQRKYVGRNRYHCVQFSSQPGLLYKFPSRAGSDDAQPALELAYALTVHKAQGSGFGATILVLMDEGRTPSPFLSREMLYTALTRHRDRLFIITNRQPGDLLAYAETPQSELAQRKSNLFGDLILMSQEDRDRHGWYDARLIHRATDGTLLRSKSELIIYNMLLAAGLNPVYEASLAWEDGKVLPDFTMTVNAQKVYWEHLGMLGNSAYKQHWEDKQRRYLAHGISEQAGNLILSYDNPLNGALDSQQIAASIEALRNRQQRPA